MCPTYYWKWYHLETGTHGLNSGEFVNEYEFLQSVNNWNRDERWKYVAIEESEYVSLFETGLWNTEGARKP